MPRITVNKPELRKATNLQSFTTAFFLAIEEYKEIQQHVTDLDSTLKKKVGSATKTRLIRSRRAPVTRPDLTRNSSVTRRPRQVSSVALSVTRIYTTSRTIFMRLTLLRRILRWRIN
jgi:hypothetical protein